MKLNLFENGKRLDPYIYSDGRDQLDLVGEILDAFDHTDLVFLRGVVGSGKSVVGIRTALEMGRGVVSVPTKVLSKQYRDDYAEGDKYFKKNNGRRAEISVMKGRSNFECPYAQGRSIPGYRKKCSAKWLPCNRGLEGNETRREALEECPYAGQVNRRENEAPMKYDKVVNYEGISDMFSVQLNTKNGKCPYWEQYEVYGHSDIIAMNSAKFMIESAWIGRLVDTPITIIDEADLFLDGLSTKVVLSQRKIERLKEDIESNIAESAIETAWSDLKEGERDPFEVSRAIKKIVSKSEIETDLYWQLEKVDKYRHECSCDKELDGKNPKITFLVANPKPILDELLNKLNSKVLMMSATAQKRHVLNRVFGIDPVFIEGEGEYPGVIKQKKTSSEVKVNYRNWKRSTFKKDYEFARDKAINVADSPAFVPVHSTKYLPSYIPKDRLLNQESIRYNGTCFSTKMDRGADLGEMQSLVMLKYPYPSIKDPLLKAMKKKLGESKFNEYYTDLSRREFIQQIGRIMREQGAVKEFWSPDETCHKKLKRHWRGEIEEGGESFD